MPFYRISKPVAAGWLQWNEYFTISAAAPLGTTDASQLRYIIAARDTAKYILRYMELYLGSDIRS